MDPQEVLEVCVNKYEKGFGWLYNQFVQLNKKWFIANPVLKYKSQHKYIQEVHNEPT